jgi:uncharacterized hydantoinase/oxoprolinase family protein
MGFIRKRLPEPPRTIVLSGCGEFLATIAAWVCPGARHRSLRVEIGSEANECAPAHAVAVLAKEREITDDLYSG